MNRYTVVPAMGGHSWDQAKVSDMTGGRSSEGRGGCGCAKHITPALCSTTRYMHKGRSGRIAHLTFRRTKKILNKNESVRN